MDRSYQSGAAGTPPDAPVNPSKGYPSAGNPASGTPATKPGAYWYHMVTEELMNVVKAAGLTPNQGDVTQLLQALRSSGLFQTPPQFDNTQKVATTEFVQRALGNRNGFYSYAVSTQLTAQHVGGTVSASSSSSISLNLPQIGSVVSGAVVEIINSGTGLLTVWPTAPDLLYAFGQAGTVSALNMQPGASMKFLSTGSGWVGFGTGQLKFDPDFKSSLAGNGYQKFPSGLIIQWGMYSGNITAGTFQKVVLPITFPTGCLRCFATAGSNGSQAQSTVGAWPISASTINVWGWETGSSNINYLAIGI